MSGGYFIRRPSMAPAISYAGAFLFFGPIYPKKFLEKFSDLMLIILIILDYF